MHRFTTFIRQPVKRQGAEQYLLITLLSFALSVTLTRLFLELTGYPQIRSGEFHIAHVLWGGLFLFIASLLPLIFANRWVYTIGACLAGIGVGLFIDEVGKFISTRMDYHFPLAAPVVYAFFLLTVLLYFRVRRIPVQGPRAELYQAFDAMEEILEHDLDPGERAELEKRLRYVADQGQNLELARLAKVLLDFISGDSLVLANRRAPWIETWLERWRKFEERWVTRMRVKAILAGALLAVGLVAMLHIFTALPIGPATNSLEKLMARLVAGGELSTSGGLFWFLTSIGLETTVGMMLLISAGLFIANRDQLGILFGYWSLLLSLTVVDLLTFYFDQFSAIITASVQFAILLVVLYYRQKYLIRSPEKIPVQS